MPETTGRLGPNQSTLKRKYKADLIGPSFGRVGDTDMDFVD